MLGSTSLLIGLLGTVWDIHHALTRANRLAMAQLDGVAHDLDAYFALGARRPVSADF